MQTAFSCGSVLVVILIAVLLWFCYNTKKDPTPSLTKTKSPGLIEKSTFNWQNNDNYDCVNNDGEIAIIEKKKHETCDLPIWLEDRKEMVFSQDCVVKGQLLGSGQFGAVFKGKFIHGKAVYVQSL